MDVSQFVIGMEVKIIPGHYINSYLYDRWDSGKADEWEHVSSVSYVCSVSFVQSVLNLTFEVVSISSYSSNFPIRISPDTSVDFDLAVSPDELVIVGFDLYRSLPLLSL